MSRRSAVISALRLRARHFRRRGGILMYHRIATESVDPWEICVSPAAFDEQMRVLAATRAAVDLGAFTADRGGVLTSGGSRLAVTFDDGYADNLTAALPILERHEIPATIFIIGNGIGRTREFWWDALERAILCSGPLPEHLSFPFGSGPQEFTLARRGCDRNDDPRWRADSCEPRTERQRLFRTLWDGIVVLEPAEQDAAIDHLLAWADQPATSPPHRLPVTDEQFDVLAAHPLITIGSHTLDHASLTDHPLTRQRVQIAGGQALLTERVGRPVTRFSYPYGRFDDATRALVADLGIDSACTSVPMSVTAADDRHALPRLQAIEMDGDRFARWLRVGHGLLADSSPSTTGIVEKSVTRPGRAPTLP